MRLTVSTKDISKSEGIVYVLLIYLEDKELIKIGVTSGKVEDRVVSILKSIWARYRVFPKCVVKRYRTTDSIFTKEKELHNLFDEFRYKTEHCFSGCTEMFDTDLDTILEAYDNRIPK